MDKLDVKKSVDAYRAELGRFRTLDVPDAWYLMVDGHGDPNSAVAFREAVEALYPVAYKVKFASKRELGRDYVVPPLEGLWWADDMASFTAARDKHRWDWTLMILVPDWVERDLVGAAIEQVAATNPPARLRDVRLELLSEGLCAQTLHVGPFDSEAEVLRRLHEEFIPAQGLHMVGTLHEIYLSDSRRVAPDMQRTILRQPVRTSTPD